MQAYSQTYCFDCLFLDSLNFPQQCHFNLFYRTNLIFVCVNIIFFVNVKILLFKIVIKEFMSNKEINNLICGFDIKRAHISQIEQSSIAQISLCKFDMRPHLFFYQSHLVEKNWNVKKRGDGINLEIWKEYIHRLTKRCQNDHQLFFSDSI